MGVVHVAAPVKSYEAVLRRLVDDRFASRLAARDHTLWGRGAEEEAAKRLAWVDLAKTSRPLLPRIAAARDDLRASGLDHVVLCGMGGSSLAPEVICATAGVELTVLDSSDPAMVRQAVGDRLATSVVVVASKSGGTVETDSQRRTFEQAYEDAGLSAKDHLVIVTDPGSPLDEYATAAGYRVFRADPQVGGRYSALTAFGLVPCGLAGVPLAGLLEQAAAVHDDYLTDSVENLALRLGVLLGVAADNDVDKLVLVDHTGTGIGDWIEQLVAESTGKHDRGILPVVTTPDALGAITPDCLVVAIGTEVVPDAPSGYAAAVDLPLGSQMILWEIATSVAGEIIDINPFDQPDVESAKKAARGLLGDDVELPSPATVDGDIELFGTTATTVEEALAELFASVREPLGYLALQVYLDRWTHAGLAQVRSPLSLKIGRPVTFGWGPRFLHSTGQYHKGGTPTGSFLQVTGTPAPDLEVPGRDFSFGQFITAQAVGDGHVLTDRGRPVLRLHLTDVESGLARLREALA
ncbi:glucose-6-phosphate isomerase [Aeromicrobium sp. Leaf350]|uniref:glucose-6-phosphate isomerase n=1 Tax=Aeromicrobium sp. Leaf350 TaxID=2876565 RepID=UPI001E32AA5B|nr:glucose-6-phosphate isomerase [Aeromicrobium sp. Leaf350]